MKKCKVIISLVLVVALICALFVACAPADQTGQNNDKPVNNPSTSDNNSDNTVGDSDQQDEEVVTIKMIANDFQLRGMDHGERINKAINALTIPAINVAVEVTFLGSGDYAAKVQTAIAGGEQIDVLTADFMHSVNTLYQKGMVMDITDQLSEFAPEALAVVGDEIAPYIYDGRTFGLPVHRNLLTCRWLVMNKNVLEEIGMLEKAENLTTWSEFEEILAVVKDKKISEGMYPILANSGSIFQGALFTSDDILTNPYDTLGSNASVVYTDQEGHVSLLQAEDAYVYANKLGASWDDKGYVYPDSKINTTLSGNDLLNQGVGFSLVCNSEFGIAGSSNYSFPIVAQQVSDYMLTTGSLTNCGMAVPITSEEPEAACKFLNMLYTNPELMDIFVYGEEGVDYEIVDGQVSTLENGYVGGNFIFGNCLLLTPSLGQGADFNEVVAQKMASSATSRYLGFTVNNAELELVISQLSAVNDQYASSMTNGDFTDSLHSEYIEKLKTAGVQDYLDAVQTQLDAWLASNK